MDGVAISPPSRVEAARKHLLALKKNAKYSLEKCFKLIQPHVSDEMVAEHLARLRSRDFADVVEERTEVKVICGMPNCATSIVKTRAQILMMNPLKGRIEENMERGKYCSTRCFEKATEILQALDNSLPLSRTNAEVEAMKAKLKRILAAETHNLAAVYGDAAEAAAIQHRENALRAVADEENSFLEKDSTARSAHASLGNTSRSTSIVAGKAVNDKAQLARQAGYYIATNHTLQEIDHTLEYLGEALPALEFESGDDSDDFNVDGGVASGTAEMVRNAYRADWFAKLNNAPTKASRASGQQCSSELDADNRNPRNSPDTTLTSSSPSGARADLPDQCDSTANGTTYQDIDTAEPLAACGRANEEDMSDLFARIDTYMRQWVTRRTISLLAAATMGLDSSTLSTCEHMIAEFERQAAIDDAPKAGVVYGPVEQQRRAVLQRQLVSFFAQCNFPLVHRQSGEEFEPGRHGPRSVVALICRSLHLASGKPLPGLQPAHWHLITLAFLAGAGLYAPDIARFLGNSSSNEQQIATSANTVSAEWARITNRCKFLPSELKLFLSPDYWKRFRDRAKDLRP